MVQGRSSSNPFRDRNPTSRYSLEASLHSEIVELFELPITFGSVSTQDTGQGHSNGHNEGIHIAGGTPTQEVHLEHRCKCRNPNF